MQVYISSKAGPLTNDGAELRKRSGIETINVVGRGLLDIMELDAFAVRNSQGFQVGDDSEVVMIFGGRKSLVRELSVCPLLLRPAPGEELWMRGIRQTGAVRPASEEALMRLYLPKIAIDHGKGMATDTKTDPQTGNVSQTVSPKRWVIGTAKTAAAMSETLTRSSKKYTYLQIYSGPPQTRDRKLTTNSQPLSMIALAAALQAIPGWDS